MKYRFFVTLVICVFIDVNVNASYAAGIAKKPNKYLKYLKTRSMTTSTPRYLQTPNVFQDNSFSTPNSPYITPRQELSSSAHLSGYTGPMMTSASERSPSRIIIVRQPYSSKKSHSSSTSSYGSQYMPQASSMAPSIAYPYGASPYGYSAHQYMPGYNYQTPMGGTPFGSQMSSYSPLVASMIAAAQRVTQTQAGAYGNQFSGSQVAPQYYSPYGMSPVQQPLYGGYGYQG